MRCEMTLFSLLNLIVNDKSVVISVFWIVVYNLRNIFVIVQFIYYEYALIANFDEPSYLFPCILWL